MDKATKVCYCSIYNKKNKEDVLREHFQNPLRIEGGKIFVMKELPKQMILKWKAYKKLTDKIKTDLILMGNGLSFTFLDEKKNDHLTRTDGRIFD